MPLKLWEKISRFYGKLGFTIYTYPPCLSSFFSFSLFLYSCLPDQVTKSTLCNLLLKNQFTTVHNTVALRRCSFFCVNSWEIQRKLLSSARSFFACEFFFFFFSFVPRCYAPFLYCASLYVWSNPLSTTRVMRIRKKKHMRIHICICVYYIKLW